MEIWSFNIYRLNFVIDGAILNFMKTDVISSNPDILGGIPVFRGTRVPVKNLIDYLEGGHDIQEFLDDFPSVEKEQVIKVLEAAKTDLLAS